jgi:hypothetical protein
MTTLAVTPHAVARTGRRFRLRARSGRRPASPGGGAYSVAGTLTETLPVTDWLARAYRRDTGELVGAVRFQGAAWDCPTNGYTGPVDVVIVALIGDRWEANHVYEAGDYAYQTDLAANLFFFRCTAGGLSGSSEPAWPTTAGNTVGDGAVTWECMGLIPLHWINGPFVPT